MTACLVLVRHAQASFDQDDYDRLSALGERQAEAIARWWKAAGRPPARLIGGTLERHRRTAAPLLAAVGGTWTEDPGLREFDHREIFYRHRPDLLDAAALAAWKAAPGDYPLRFEETWAAALGRWMDPAHAADYAEPWACFRARCAAALAALLADLDEDGTALAFTSSGPVAVALMDAWQTGDRAFPAVQGSLCNAGFTELWRVGAAAPLGRPGQVNACPHLAAELRSLR